MGHSGDSDLGEMSFEWMSHWMKKKDFYFGAGGFGGNVLGPIVLFSWQAKYQQ